MASNMDYSNSIAVFIECTILEYPHEVNPRCAVQLEFNKQSSSDLHRNLPDLNNSIQVLHRNYTTGMSTVCGS